MEEIPLVEEFLVIFILSIVVLLSCYRLKIPSVVGFLITGIICGPYGFGLVHQIEDVQALANIGIVLLLFTVGMEVSIKKILEIRRLFFLGGLFQIGLTVFFGAVVGIITHQPLAEAIFLGCLISLSSTAVVLRLLAQKGESDTPHGRGTLAILIFQDFCTVPMMLMIPMLAGTYGGFHWTMLYVALKGILIIASVFVASWWLVPKLLYLVAKTRIRELFLLTVFFICLAVAWFSQLAGLSLSLGAFLAGLIISQSDFSHEAISDITPFQDLFTSFFFVSIGMLLDIGFVAEHPFLIISITLAIIALKTVAATMASSIAGMPLRTAVWIGLSLAQISEFAFVLAKVASDIGLAPIFHYQLFLAVAILSISLTPWIMACCDKMSQFSESLPFPDFIKKGFKAPKTTTVAELKDHVVIIGYGLGGRIIARSCKNAEIPYIILEMNAQTVKKELARGEPIHYGDASHESVLEYVKIHSAKVAAIVINDAGAALRVIRKIRQINPHIFLLVRTRYMSDVKTLKALGANEVVSEDYGSAMEIFTRVMHAFEVPSDKIETMRSETAKEALA